MYFLIQKAFCKSFLFRCNLIFRFYIVYGDKAAARLLWNTMMEFLLCREKFKRSRKIFNSPMDNHKNNFFNIWSYIIHLYIKYNLIFKENKSEQKEKINSPLIKNQSNLKENKSLYQSKRLSRRRPL